MTGRDLINRDKELSSWWLGVCRDDRFDQVIALCRADLFSQTPAIPTEQICGANKMIDIMSSIVEVSDGGHPIPSPGLIRATKVSELTDSEKSILGIK